MPQLTRRLPRYCRHKGSGRACVYLDGKAVYLGPHGSPESRARYKAVVAEWLGGERPERTAAPTAAPTPRAVTVSELVAEYRRHAEAYYSASRETHNIRDSVKPMRAMFGAMAANDFGPSHLRQVRERMIRSGLARKVVNSRVNRIRRMVRWGVSMDLVRPEVLLALQSLEPLRPGRGGRETEPVKPVSWEAVEAALPHLSPMVRDMVMFGWLTGARPGEVLGLTTAAIDRSGEVWIARIARHKNTHRGLGREIVIGPKAREALAPWLLPDRPDDPIFSPRRVKGARRKGRRAPGKAYSRNGFAQAIERGCKRAGVPVWTPNQLRHACATRLRSRFGLEGARVALGHARTSTTEIYAERDLALAREVMREVG